MSTYCTPLSLHDPLSICNVTVQAVVANPDHALRPGMYVATALNLPPQHGALVVPATAIQTSASGDSVTVVRGRNGRSGGKAETIAVTTGRRVGRTRSEEHTSELQSLMRNSYAVFC